MASPLPPDVSLEALGVDDRSLRAAPVETADARHLSVRSPEDWFPDDDPDAEPEEHPPAGPRGPARLLGPLLRPVRTARPGTMPAGTVMVVVATTLVLALALCAGAIDRKAAGRRPNSDSRRGIAGAVAALTSALGLDRPEAALSAAVDPALGHAPGRGGARSGDLADAARAVNGADPDAIRAGAGAGPVHGQPTVPRAEPSDRPADDGTPHLRVATPDRPLRLWLGGDSVSQEVGLGLSRLAGETRLFDVVREARPSTGLARPDYFNWPEHLAHDVAPVEGGGVDPDVVVLMFGGNDDQNLPAWRGAPAEMAGSPGWIDQYRRRVGDTMDLLKSPDNDRLVIWPGMPVSQPGTLPNRTAINAVYASEAARRPWVRYVDSSAFLSDAFGRYAPVLGNADGRAREMRASDGIHLSAAGGLRLAHAIYAKLALLVDLSAAPLAPDPSQVAPPSVVERPLEVILNG